MEREGLLKQAWVLRLGNLMDPSDRLHRVSQPVARRMFLKVSLAGEPVTLSRKEYALLAFLVQHAGRVVTQPQLLREIWGPTHQEDTHYLRILVAKLRQKLGDEAATPRWIATEPGVGLRFLLP